MFNFKGRINRTTFLLGNLYLALLVFPIYAIDPATLENKIESSALLSILLLVLAVCITYLSVSLLVRRLHDLGLSAWFVLVTLLPGVQLVLLFLPGQKIKNKYGYQPTKRFNHSTLFSS